MKKFRIILALFIIVVALLTAIMPVNASGGTGNLSITVNNRMVSANVMPVYLNGVAMVPVKEFVTALGGSFNYDTGKMSGVCMLGQNELVFRLDNSTAKINDKFVSAPGPMKVLGNRYMVPAGFTAEKLGAEVYMNVGKNILMVFQPIDGKLVYQVMPGDSLWSISQIFRTSVTTIKQLNGLGSDVIYVGQKLIIKNMTEYVHMNGAQTTASATLRTGAGTGFSILGYLQAWTDISVTGKSGNWYKVVTPKGNGYIYYSVVKVRQDISDSTPDSMYFDSIIPVNTSKNYVTYTSYTVQKGDTLWSIALKTGIPERELANANGLSLSAMLNVGQVLNIPIHNIAVKSTLGAQYGEILDWFKEGQYVFQTGKTGKFIDMETGKSFYAKRTMGANHADTETLTAQDSQIMKDIFGGAWSWKVRPFILELNGRRFAVSVSGMPHAGVDGVPYLQNVSNRSGNFGYGPNYETIAGNGMDGHFDVYFLNGQRHVDGKLDSGHQYGTLVAGGLE